MNCFNVGKHVENVKHAQLHMKCSKLNSQLFSLHISVSVACVCGHNVQDSGHYYKLHCPIYFVPRQTKLQNLHIVIDIQDLNVDILLCGSDNYDFKTNSNMIINLY